MSTASGQSTFKITSESHHFPSLSLQPPESKPPSIISRLYYWNNSLTGLPSLYLLSFSLFSHDSKNNFIKISNTVCYFRSQNSPVAIHTADLKSNSLTIDCKAIWPFLLSLFYFSHADLLSVPQRAQERSCFTFLHLLSLPVLPLLKTSAPIAHSISLSLIKSFLLCAPSVATLWNKCIPLISTFMLSHFFL